MIVYKPVGDIAGDVRGLGAFEELTSPITAGAITAADAEGSPSIWRPVLIGTLTAGAAWLLTRILESAFEPEDFDDSDDDDEDEPEEDEDETP